MNIDEYKQAVIALLKSDAATDEMWEEVAACVLYSSEIHDGTPNIDAIVFP